MQIREAAQAVLDGTPLPPSDEDRHGHRSRTMLDEYAAYLNKLVDLSGSVR